MSDEQTKCDPLPPLNPQTKEPAGAEDLTPVFPMAPIEQEVSPKPLVCRQNETFEAALG
ncbi:MAG TPA: hypothetical protein VNB64_13910 [Solirubrobacteraceae bacterium]|nr:hypothetical protein [Solirubrobacteraceae bacterium]